MKKLILFCMAVAATASIFSCKCLVDGCADVDSRCMLWFNNYQEVDVSPMVLISYEKGTNFTVYRDSTYYKYPLNSNSGPSYAAFFQDSVDYIISLPTIGQKYYITNMRFNTQQCRGGCGKTSIRALESCYVNGVTKSVGIGLYF